MKMQLNTKIGDPRFSHNYNLKRVCPNPQEASFRVSTNTHPLVPISNMFQTSFRASEIRENSIVHRQQHPGLVFGIRRAFESGRRQHGVERHAGRAHRPHRSFLRRHRLRQLHSPRHGARRFPPDLSAGIRGQLTYLFIKDIYSSKML
jgi:hypothetical protein